MKYRKFGKKKDDVSILGFGVMRLPLIDKDTKNIDIKETSKMINYAFEKGVNYYDTAYPYHEGLSESVLGNILNENKLRDKVKIATKQPCWLIEKYEDFDKYLNEQLERLKTDHIDYYLLHALFSERWEKVYNLGVLDWAEKVQKQGKIGELGFSFHDGLDSFRKIVDVYDKWSFCQIQYNYIGEDVQAGRKGLQYASSKGLSVIVMEPLLGGQLANPPEEINKMFIDNNMNPVGTSLQWLWDQKELSIVLSGVSNFTQIKENIKFAENSDVNHLTEKQNDLLKSVVARYRKLRPVNCTKCKYCMPCPNNVDIPYNFEVFNESEVNLELSKSLYTWHIPELNKASACTNCKLCEKKCPQGIKIGDLMPEIHKKLFFDT